MSMRINFVYMNEDAIEPLLKCPICKKPFIDPVITRDGDRVCRLCIIEQKNPMVDQYSSLLSNLVDLDEKLLHDMLNNILVKCIDCQEINMRRKDFHQHLLTQCPKRIVSCQANDLKCPWNGYYDQYDNHVRQCTFELLRPILSDACQYKNQLDEYRMLTNKQQNEINELKQQIQQYEDRTDKLQNSLKIFIELNSQQKLLYDKIQRDIQQYSTKQDEIYDDVQKLKEQCNQMNVLYQQVLELKIDLSNQNVLQINEFEQISQQIKETLNQYELQIKKSQELSRNNDMTHIRQTCDQHEIQIRLLARKKCVVPSKSTTIVDARLQGLIEKFQYNSEIDLTNKQIDYQNIEFICKTVINDKQCRKLRLENNDINAKCTNILADTLYGNTTLEQLYLSDNCISDMGVHALAQVLSINNSKLTVLEIHENNITDEGIEYLAEMLKTNKTLISLGLNSNQISDRGVQSLTNSITFYNQTLQSLYLASNNSITDASVECLINMITINQSLKTLWINNCNLSKNAIKQLKDAAKSNKNFILKVE